MGEDGGFVGFFFGELIGESIGGVVGGGECFGGGGVEGGLFVFDGFMLSGG